MIVLCTVQLKEKLQHIEQEAAGIKVASQGAMMEFIKLRKVRSSDQAGPLPKCKACMLRQICVELRASCPTHLMLRSHASTRCQHLQRPFAYRDGRHERSPVPARDHLILGGVQEIRDQERTVLAELLRPERCLQFLRPGRLLRIRDGQADWGWGVLVRARRNVLSAALGTAPPPRSAVLPAKEDPDAATDHYVLDVLLACAPSSADSELLHILQRESTQRHSVVSVQLPRVGLSLRHQLCLDMCGCGSQLCSLAMPVSHLP